MNVGAEWYLHTIYTVRSSTRRLKRHSMVRRAAESSDESSDLIGSNFNRGTNMHVIPMETNSVDEHLVISTGSSSWIIAAILGAVLIGNDESLVYDES